MPRRTRQLRRARTYFGFVLFLFGFVRFVAATQEPQQNRRDITIVARDHVFTPNKIEVTRDDLVKITLRSEDVPIGFAIDAYRISKRVAGQSAITFEFRADQSGTFTFFCNLTTDRDCKDMKGTLIVKSK